MTEWEAVQHRCIDEVAKRVESPLCSGVSLDKDDQTETSSDEAPTHPATATHPASCGLLSYDHMSHNALRGMCTHTDTNREREDK
jgi:hypothetical protein